MAVGRRKRLVGAILTVPGATVYTAPAAPADGSAAASVRLVLTNNNTASVNFSVLAAGAAVWLGAIGANATLTLGEIIDLMGGETLAASASVGAVLTLTGYGVEAKDA